MLISLHQITGEVFNKKFDPNEKVHNICEYLSRKLNSPPNSIFIINFEKNSTFFYRDNQMIRNITSNKRKSFIFMMANHIDSNFYSRSSKLKKFYNRLKHKSTYFQSKGFINAVNNFKEIKNIDYSNCSEYSQYADILNNVPKDYEEKVSQMVQIGYDKNDCKIALRKSNYNVEVAINILGNNHNIFNSSFNNIDLDSLISTNSFESSNIIKSNNNLSHSSSNDDFKSSFTFDSLDDSFISIDEQNNNKEKYKINKQTNTKSTKQSKPFKETQTIEMFSDDSLLSSCEYFNEPSKTTNDFDDFCIKKKPLNLKKGRPKNKNNEIKNNYIQNDNTNPVIPKSTKQSKPFKETQTIEMFSDDSLLSSVEYFNEPSKTTNDFDDFCIKKKPLNLKKGRPKNKNNEIKTNSDENPMNFDSKMITGKIKNDINSPKEIITKIYKKITNLKNHQPPQYEENIHNYHKPKNYNFRPSSTSSIQIHHHLHHPPPPPPPVMLLLPPPPPPNQRFSNNANEECSYNEYHFSPTCIQEPLEISNPFHNYPMKKVHHHCHHHRREKSIEHHYKPKNSSPSEFDEEYPNFRMKMKPNNINKSDDFIEKSEPKRQRNCSVKKNQVPPFSQQDKQQIHYSNHHKHHKKRSTSISNHSKPSSLNQPTLTNVKQPSQDLNPPYIERKTIFTNNFVLFDKPPKLGSSTPKPKSYI